MDESEKSIDNVTPDGEELAAIQVLESYLGHPMRLHTRDGRAFTGSFVITDREANIVLQASEESRGVDDQERRYMGMVCVPGKEILKIEISDVKYL